MMIALVIIGLAGATWLAKLASDTLADRERQR